MLTEGSVEDDNMILGQREVGLDKMVGFSQNLYIGS